VTDTTTSPKRRLGRGLDALLGSPTQIVPIPSNTPSDGPRQGLVEVDVNSVKPNPEQPRHEFNESDLSALADSIRIHGLLHPIVIEDHSDSWVLVAGERRLRAAKLAGLTRIAAIVRPAAESERNSLELALTENLVRADLSPLEEAMAYSRLADTFGLTHEAIALRLGKSRPLVTNTIRLLTLSAPVQRAVSEGRLSAGHARTLLALTDLAAQERAAQVVEKEGMSVRGAERYVQQLLAPAAAKKPAHKPTLSVDDQAVQRGLEQAVGAPVRLERRRKGGRVMIEFASNEDLDALYNRLGGAPL
jgi:ParB family transcriptional regulator, chromosome partitioning protein